MFNFKKYLISQHFWLHKLLLKTTAPPIDCECKQFWFNGIDCCLMHTVVILGTNQFWIFILQLHNWNCVLSKVSHGLNRILILDQSCWLFLMNQLKLKPWCFDECSKLELSNCFTKSRAGHANSFQTRSIIITKTKSLFVLLRGITKWCVEEALLNSSDCYSDLNLLFSLI